MFTNNLFNLKAAAKTTARRVALLGALVFGNMALAADIDVNADVNDVAIKGYDTVAYFSAGKAVKGTGDYTASYKNAIYQFSSKKNRDAFRANPAKYAPQFGGYCAYGVTKEKKFDTDPTAWKIVDGKLYLNLNKKVQKVWVKDIPGNLASAYQIWPDIKSVRGEDL